jgi:hypothetical protein
MTQSDSTKRVTVIEKRQAGRGEVLTKSGRTLADFYLVGILGTVLSLAGGAMWLMSL